MSSTAQFRKLTVVQEIADYVGKCGLAYSQWYCGIAAFPESRLFNDHNVDHANGAWIYRTCNSSEEARAIEEHFLRLGMQGGGGGGDWNTKAVYAYRITNSTRE